MRVRTSARRIPFAAVLAVTAMASCFAEPGLPTEPPPEAPTAGEPNNEGGRDGAAGDSGGGGGEDIQPQGGDGGATDPPITGRCDDVEGSEDLPARAIVSASDIPVDTPYFTADLFALFDSTCGGCHKSQAAGGFQVGLSTFPSLVTADVVKLIKGEDEPFMPPLSAGGMDFAKRKPDDPVRILVSQLEAWLAQGSPPDVFILPAGSGSEGVYHLDRPVAAKLTNLGTCVAEKRLVGADRQRMRQMDEMFAELERIPTGSPAERLGLPARLDGTDLVSLDSGELAKQGVVAFSPLYPLWSDGSGKLRYVRVPLGESIRYDSETREFEIPPNTRFYKTFLKKTIEANGDIGYRKVETRLIVARPDRKLEDGTYEPTALFGTYVWNEYETEATLLTNPLKNGEPFADLVKVLVLDEPGAQAVRDRAPPPRNLAYALEDAGVLRRYGIPGSARCVECHRGSQSQSFVLGFTPMQLARRPKGEGGVIEESGRDELTQLQRLVDYGLITGLDPVEAPKLEDSQLPRKPRTVQELTAQGYLFGNCGHCHNPRGFASLSNPSLAPLLDFWPGGGGGIFEFPLDRVSPRIKRGEQQSIDVPYITPSLRDLIPMNFAGDPASASWTEKAERPTPENPNGFIPAPWRAAIYRNVDTPFTYSDHYAIFPHMPRHTSGFDCRLPRIMGDWMVSLPAKLKDPFKNQDAKPCKPEDPGCRADFSSQPYLEVRAGEAGYEKALADAEKRLAEYHAGSRYSSYCPDGKDIMDRGVIEGHRVVPEDRLVDDLPRDGVPDLPHYAPFDLTDPGGPYQPRRFDWVQYLAEKRFPPPGDLSPTDLVAYQRSQAEKLQVLDIVQTVTLGKLPDFEAMALTERPFGLWEKKDGCDFEEQKRASDFTGNAEPIWMADLRAKNQVAAGDPVYMQTPAAAVYGMICINCHGVNADSKGRQAATLSDMTGGAARVANLRDGLFGGNGANIQHAFGDEAMLPQVAPENWPSSVPWPGGSAQDWAARYMAWMALGGTQQKIPASVTNLVLNTTVLGEARPPLSSQPVVSANMLAVAQLYCSWFLPMNETSIMKRGESDPNELELEYDEIFKWSGLIRSNGDLELWRDLCHFDNPPPVRGIMRTSQTWLGSSIEAIVHPTSFYAPTAYPADAPVGDQHGNVTVGIQPGNLFPWCVRVLGGSEELAELEQQRVNGQPVPICPDALLAESNRWLGNIDGARPPDGDYRDDHRGWSTRGAISAGLSVFLYLREFSQGRLQSKPNYNECELLAGP